MKVDLSNDTPQTADKGAAVSLLKKYLPRLPRKVQMLENASLARLFACQTGVDDADVPLSSV